MLLMDAEVRHYSNEFEFGKRLPLNSFSQIQLTSLQTSCIFHFCAMHYHRIFCGSTPNCVSFQSHTFTLFYVLD